MREGNPGNPPGGYEELQDPAQIQRLSSLLVMHLQCRLADGGSLSDIVDLDQPHTASSGDYVSPWEPCGIDAGIAHISNKTAVCVTLSIGAIDGHDVWCMSGTARSNMPAPHSSGGAGVGGAGSAFTSEGGAVMLSPRKRRGAGSSGCSSLNLGNQELETFEEFCVEFDMFREPVPGNGSCMPSSVAQGMLWQDHISGRKTGQFQRKDREQLSETIRKDVVTYAVEHSEDFQAFFVSDPKSRGDTGPQDGVRGKSPKDWSVPMLKSGTYGDDLLLQCIAFHLEKEIQVFSFDKDTNTMRMKTIYDVMRSKEESATSQNTDRRPTVSDFEENTVLRLTHFQHQHHGAAHYDCLITNKVCERSLGACPLPGTQSVRIFS